LDFLKQRYQGIAFGVLVTNEDRINICGNQGAPSKEKTWILLVLGPGNRKGVSKAPDFFPPSSRFFPVNFVRNRNGLESGDIKADPDT
jgi:hypothetical protein